TKGHYPLVSAGTRRSREWLHGHVRCARGSDRDHPRRSAVGVDGLAWNVLTAGGDNGWHRDPYLPCGARTPKAASGRLHSAPYEDNLRKPAIPQACPVVGDMHRISLVAAGIMDSTLPRGRGRFRSRNHPHLPVCHVGGTGDRRMAIWPAGASSISAESRT